MSEKIVNSKPWYCSRTMWVAIATAVLPAALSIAEVLPKVIDAKYVGAASVVLGIIIGILRKLTTGPVGKPKAPPASLLLCLALPVLAVGCTGWDLPGPSPTLKFIVKAGLKVGLDKGADAALEGCKKDVSDPNLQAWCSFGAELLGGMSCKPVAPEAPPATKPEAPAVPAPEPAPTVAPPK